MSLVARAREVARDREEAEAAEARPPGDVVGAIGVELRPLQREILAAERRFNAEVIHRRFGKTVMKVVKLLDRACWCPRPKGRYAYMAPTYSQAEDIAWLYLEDYHARLLRGMGLDPYARRWRNASRLSVYVPTRDGDVARVRLYGLDSPKQRVRGLYLDGVVFDEWPWIPPSAWSSQVRPMLMDDERACFDGLGRRNQWADFVFTPFGRNHGYETWRKADLWARGLPVVARDPVSGEETVVTSDEWWACLHRASETGVLSEKELAAYLGEVGRSEYDREMECSWDAGVVGAIFARELEDARAQGRVVDRRLLNPLLPVNTAWDLGYDDATAIWFFQQVGEEVRLVDYYEASGAGLDHYADVLAERRYRYGYHLFPHDVEHHEVGSGKSRRSVLRSLGIRVTATPKPKKKDDAIAAARALLGRCVFDEGRCSEGLDRLALYRREWDERRGVARLQPLHDWASHGADALQTLALGIRRAPRAGGPDPHAARAAETG